MRKEIRGIGEKALGGEIVGMKEVLPLLGTQGPDILDLAAVDATLINP